MQGQKTDSLRPNARDQRRTLHRLVRPHTLIALSTDLELFSQDSTQSGLVDRRSTGDAAQLLIDEGLIANTFCLGLGSESHQQVVIQHDGNSSFALCLRLKSGEVWHRMQPPLAA